MKKRIGLLLCLLWMLTMAGCGNSSNPSGKPGSNQPAGVNDVLEQGIAEANKEESQASETSAKPDASSKSEEPSSGVDVDLTALSSTMVYSEVSHMMTSPEDYIGKTVKMKGLFAYYHDEATDNYYFACIIQDATACCAQGIEFILPDEYTYPEDYPEVNEEICVVGVFDTYQEGDNTYCTLRNASLL